MVVMTQSEAEAARLEAEMAEVCGVLNAATGHLVELIARVLATGCWQGFAIRSPSHWVAWKCGVSPARAATLVAMATRLSELPATRAALAAGELSEDQAAAVCRHAPASTDAEVAQLARSATVTQLRRCLTGYCFVPAPAPAADDPPAEEARRVNFGYTDAGSWRLSALLPPDEGAAVERALAEARDSLFHRGDAKASWAEALTTLAERSLASGAVERPHRDRYVVLVHLDTELAGHLHLGPVLPEPLRRLLTCDARLRPVVHAGRRAVSVGRTQRAVPDRTRMVVEERDRGCAVPGCARSRWLQVHHIVHWEDGGATDTANLVALCSAHHRAHHLGRLGIAGDADDPAGLVFSDERGRHLDASGRPVPPGAPLGAAVTRLGIVPGVWVHATGERLDEPWVWFNEPTAASP